MRHPSLALLALAFGLYANAARAEAPKTTRIGKEALPVGVKPLSTLVTALRWSDAAGDNVAVLSRSIDEKRGDGRLQVELWSGKGGQGGVVRTLKEAVLRCEFDLRAEFLDEALGVTDLDGDGVGELTFAYRTTCTSDVSPFSLKVFLLEQRAKYGLRGSTIVDVGGGEKVGGEKTADPALRKQPQFLKHLESVWQRVVALNPWT